MRVTGAWGQPFGQFGTGSQAPTSAIRVLASFIKNDYRHVLRFKLQFGGPYSERDNGLDALVSVGAQHGVYVSRILIAGDLEFVVRFDFQITRVLSTGAHHSVFALRSRSPSSSICRNHRPPMRSPERPCGTSALVGGMPFGSSECSRTWITRWMWRGLVTTSRILQTALRPNAVQPPGGPLVTGGHSGRK